MSAPAIPAEDGPPLSELDSLQLKANTITDDSLDSTRRMIGLCEESQTTGARTISMLEQQGEQLGRIEGDLENMGGELKQAEKHLIGMEKWCGLCVCPWNRGSSRVRDKDATWAAAPTENGGGNVATRQPAGAGAGATSRPDGPYIQRINDDAREDEMEENMQAVGSMLGNLKAMAQDMGSEIGNQNKQLDRINVKAGTTDGRIVTANERTAKLLK